MKRLFCLLAACVLLGGSVVHAGQGRGRGASSDDHARGTTVSVRPVEVSIVFSPREITLIRSHYQSRESRLPPGLQKKLARGGSLPPGWQKKMEPFPAALEREMIVLGSGHKYGVYDGHAVIYHPITHAILDIISLF